MKSSLQPEYNTVFIKGAGINNKANFRPPDLPKANMSQTIPFISKRIQTRETNVVSFQSKVKEEKRTILQMNLRGFVIAVVLVWATIQESVSFSAGIGNMGLGKKRAFNQNWKNQVLKVGVDLLQ